MEENVPDLRRKEKETKELVLFHQKHGGSLTLCTGLCWFVAVFFPKSKAGRLDGLKLKPGRLIPVDCCLHFAGTTRDAE